MNECGLPPQRPSQGSSRPAPCPSGIRWGGLQRHLGHHDLSWSNVTPVSEPDDDVHPLGFEPCHLFGHRLQLVLDDEGARVGHLGGDGHDGDDLDGDDEEERRMLTPPRSLG